MIPRGVRLLGIAAALLCIALGAIGAASAAESKNYAYLFIQGRLSEATDGRPLANATVELADGMQVHQAVSDSKGVFVFEKLPVSNYGMEVRTETGEVVRRVRRLDTANLDLMLLELQVGRGNRDESPEIVLENGPQRIDVVVPERRTNRGKLWKEMLIFIGAAGILAL